MAVLQFLHFIPSGLQIGGGYQRFRYSGLKARSHPWRAPLAVLRRLSYGFPAPSTGRRCPGLSWSYYTCNFAAKWMRRISNRVPEQQVRRRRDSNRIASRLGSSPLMPSMAPAMAYNDDGKMVHPGSGACIDLPALQVTESSTGPVLPPVWPGAAAAVQKLWPAEHRRGEVLQPMRPGAIRSSGQADRAGCQDWRPG